MMTRDDIRTGCADLLRTLRKKHGLSIRKMADTVYCDDHTWAKYEKGTASPSVVDFFYTFTALGEHALPMMLALLYPDIYNSDAGKASRTEVVHYFNSIAGDKEIDEMAYLISGEHGSNMAAQVQMFTMINHLPMAYKVAVADLVNTLWQLADSRGELICTDKAMPDVDVFRDGLRQGKEAAYQKRNTYTVLP